MLKIISFIFLIFLAIFCKAQGSWNIGYIQVDSINEKHIGYVVRIDFKSNKISSNPEGRRNIRSYIGTKDTGTVTIEAAFFIMTERRKIYVDHGNFSDQFLECINCKEETFVIYDAKILQVDEQSIQFELDIETKKGDLPIKRELKIVRIDRNKLDGVLYKL